MHTGIGFSHVASQELAHGLTTCPAGQAGSLGETQLRHLKLFEVETVEITKTKET